MRLLTALSVSLALLAAVPPARAAAAPTDPLAALQSAVDRGDAGAVLAARATFDAAATADRKAAAPRYGVALADWRALPLLWEKDKPRAKQLAADGLKRIDEAIALQPKWGAAYALKGALQGMSIGLDPSAMMTLGPEAAAQFQRARGLAPDDPRVWILDGIQTLNTPPMFGGGVEAALTRFARAQHLFESDSARVEDGLVWGRDDAWLWAGRAEMSRQHPSAAAAHYRRALAANPANGWVSRALLPQAEQAARDSVAK
jgi:hypothetical protein